MVEREEGEEKRRKRGNWRRRRRRRKGDSVRDDARGLERVRETDEAKRRSVLTPSRGCS